MDVYLQNVFVYQLDLCTQENHVHGIHHTCKIRTERRTKKVKVQNNPTIYGKPFNIKQISALNNYLITIFSFLYKTLVIFSPYLCTYRSLCVISSLSTPFTLTSKCHHLSIDNGCRSRIHLQPPNDL